MPIPQRALLPPAAFMQLVTGECIAHCISAAAHLGLADRMAKGPQPSDELAHACGAHAPYDRDSFLWHRSLRF